MLIKHLEYHQAYLCAQWIVLSKRRKKQQTRKLIVAEVSATVWWFLYLGPPYLRKEEALCSFCRGNLGTAHALDCGCGKSSLQISRKSSGVGLGRHAHLSARVITRLKSKLEHVLTWLEDGCKPPQLHTQLVGGSVPLVEEVIVRSNSAGLLWVQGYSTCGSWKANVLCSLGEWGCREAFRRCLQTLVCP